jgi:magnesium transporter
MMQVFGVRDGRLVGIETGCAELSQTGNVVWIDLCNPTRDEELCVEDRLGVDIPTRQELAEIEDSARLYEERGALVMTAVLIQGAAEGRPSSTLVTFVLTRAHLVTVRYAETQSFRNFEAKRQRQAEALVSADRVLFALLESIVERAADVLEQVGAELNEVSNKLFLDEEASGRRRRKATRVENELQVLIKRLGRKFLTISILRESLLSLSRLLPFLRAGAGEWLANGAPARLKQIERDLRSLASYEAQLSSGINYLHEASLGLINLEQNRIIKAFTIAAVLFLPPTVVGAIYGMNFKHMPELDWTYGYPFALALILLSEVAPYYWFKRKGWL